MKKSRKCAAKIALASGSKLINAAVFINTKSAFPSSS
jgi:hypothetical protein